MYSDTENALLAKVAELETDLKRLWHFSCCPFEHCQRCIDDAAWIKGLHDRLGAPSDLAEELPPISTKSVDDPKAEEHRVLFESIKYHSPRCVCNLCKRFWVG
jgi:hypothetical protein